MLLNLTYLIKVFGAGQLDVAAKAVSARFDTLWYSKGNVLNLKVLNVVFAVHSCLQLFKLNAPVDTTISEWLDLVNCQNNRCSSLSIRLHHFKTL